MAAKNQIAKVVGEALIVAVIGAGVAFVANAISPRGLRLSEDYFPGATEPRPKTARQPERPGTNAPSAFQELAAHFEAKGLRLGGSNEVMQLFRDPRMEQNLIVFLDARKDEEYQAGHIPGAWRLDRYHLESALIELGPLCLSAQQVVVYCGGGSCEESEFAAIQLRDILSLPREKLLVYGGGFTEWSANQWPIEEGERKSGRLRNTK